MDKQLLDKTLENFFLNSNIEIDFGNFFIEITKKLAEFQAEQNNLESNFTKIKLNDIKDPK